MSGRFEKGDVVGGDFEIVRLLGEGGMGAVYEARQLSTGALRALKTMLPELARDDAFRQRFTREAQIIAQVESEHVTQVLTAGIDPAQGIPWLAMELLKGEDLAARLARSAPLDYETTREIFAQIGHAFGAAHAAGIVHRDLKPENVFLCEARTSTRSLTVKILDFGIAKVLTGTIATTTGALGSPLWMAPEQTVKDGTISPATDVWALGLLAFHVLTGNFYWHAPSSAGGTPMTLLREITMDPLETASARSKTLGGPTLPPDFDAWFARCLERDPADRFRDAGEAVPPLLALLAAAPKRAPRAIELMVTQGVPKRDAGQPAPPTTAAARVRTDTAFANTEGSTDSLAPVAPARPRFSRAAIAFASIVAIGAFFAARHFYTSGPTASTLPSASALPSAPLVVPPSASVSPAAKLATAEEERRARAAKMITIPGTTFTIGSASGPADERPPVELSVAGFELDAAEVSVSAYFACIDAGKCKPTGTAGECNATDEARRNHPINCVGYADAKAYCEWLDKRLPSEMEWEVAARGKAGRRFPWGAAAPAEQLCWRRLGPDASHSGTCPIGTFPAGNTPEGIQDMAGNVWEWTTSRYCPYTSPSCSDERRVARGGSWASETADLVTTTVRNESFETDRGASVGFRCARGL